MLRLVGQAGAECGMDHKPPPGAGIPSPVPPWGPLRALGEVTHMTPLTQMKALKLRKKSMAKVPLPVTTGPEVSRHPLRTVGVRVGESDRRAPPRRLLPQQGGDHIETVLGTHTLPDHRAGQRRLGPGARPAAQSTSSTGASRTSYSLGTTSERGLCLDRVH